MALNKKFYNFFGYFLIGSIAFFLFLGIQTASQTLLCPDSFYHAKMASLLAEGTLIKDFFWLPLTTLSHSYANHHFLYHWLLVPFVSFFSPLIGIKVATIFFATLTVLIFYWFLKKFQIKLPLFWTFLILTSSSFLTRINLAKAPAAAIAILILSLYALFKKKYISLIIISFVYVWFYGTWPIILTITIIYCFSDALKKTITRWQQVFLTVRLKTLNPEKNFNYKNLKSRIQNSFKILLIALGNFTKHFFSKENNWLFLSCFLGVACGLIINPYFSENFSFYWMQVVKIGLQNYQNILPVGAEWYPYSFDRMIFDNFLIFFPWLIALAWFIFSAKKRKEIPFSGQSVKSFVLFFISILFFIYTIKSRRNIDYFIPSAILFSAFSFNNLIVGLPWQFYFDQIKKNKKNIGLNLSLMLVCLGTLMVVVFSIFSIYTNTWLRKKNEFAKGASFNQFKNSSEFLKENSEPGELIFHSCWGEFPSLFYHNHQNTYISGLDPTFAYIENKPLYWLWFNIVNNKQKTNLAETINKNFKSRFIFVRIDFENFKENLEKSKKIKKIYEDEEGAIFKIADQFYLENF